MNKRKKAIFLCLICMLLSVIGSYLVLNHSMPHNSHTAPNNGERPNIPLLENSDTSEKSTNANR